MYQIKIDGLQGTKFVFAYDNDYHLLYAIEGVEYCKKTKIYKPLNFPRDLGRLYRHTDIPEHLRGLLYLYVTKSFYNRSFKVSDEEIGLFDSKNKYTNYRNKIVQLFLQTGVYNFDNRRDKLITAKEIFNKGIPYRGNQTNFDHDVSILNKKYIEKIKKFEEKIPFFIELDKLEKKVSQSELVDFIKNKNIEISNNFYSINNYIHLPFLIHKEKIKFPLRIHNANKDTPKNFKEDSLLEQRQALGAILYNGRNFSLSDLSSSKQTIKTSRYYEILDSADYIASRMKAYLASNNKDDLDRVYNEWFKRINSIVNHGKFDIFTPGFAFSIPIFQKPENENEPLRVLSAKGSQFKGSGQGKKHVAPAGMFEFWSEEIYHKTEFSFENFQCLAAKELLEETIFSNTKIQIPENNNYIEYLDFFNENITEHSISYETLMSKIRDILKFWDKIWDSLGIGPSDRPSCAALEKLLSIDENYVTENSFLITDAFNLRPEVILPIYIEEKHNSILNWEYENTPEILSFMSKEDLDIWVTKHRDDWCAPGLAAVYLGAKHFFNNGTL